MRRTSLAAVMAAAGLLSLAPAAAAQEATPAPAPAAAPAQETEARPARRRADPNRITSEEITEARVRSGLDLVQRLRPGWLRTRGSGQVTSGLSSTGSGQTMQAPTIDVFLDDSYMGKVGVLRTLSLSGVAEVRYYSSSQATTRFGTGYLYGVIQFLTH